MSKILRESRQENCRKILSNLRIAFHSSLTVVLLEICFVQRSTMSSRSVQMSGISQGASSLTGVAGDLDGQSFSLGTASKDQRVSKEALLKMTRNKRQTANKTPGGQAPKEKTSPLGSKPTNVTFHRSGTGDEDQFGRTKEPSDMTETKDQRPR